MKNPLHEIRVFKSYPHNMRVLLITNLIYAFVMPIIEIFIGAYVMRNSHDTKMVIAYQLAIYTGIPFTFLLNGWLLQHIGIQRLYSLGMLISGVSMIIMMSLHELHLTGLAVAGVLMGMSIGFYWSNRDFLALSSTNDSNRNYYYGLETFFATTINIVLPVSVGAYIASGIHGIFANIANSIPHADGSLAFFKFVYDKIIAISNHIPRGVDADAIAAHGYHVVTIVVFVLAIIASIAIHQGKFENPPKTKFLYFRFHWLWYYMQMLAILKGMAQGYIVTAPAMLVMTLTQGKEGSLGTLVTIGTIFSAILLYILGRTTGPKHRIYIFGLGLALFVVGAIPVATNYNEIAAVIFMVCLVLGRPLQDIAYFTIQMLVIDTVSAIEKRNKYAYIFNQEFGFFIGRFLGCGLFLLLAFQISNTFALRYSILIIGVIQLLSVFFARIILKGCADHGAVLNQSGE